MAIQLPNPGLGDGQTGDNEFVMWTKVKDNFSNTTHAASRLVGVSKGQIPLADDVHKANYSYATLDAARSGQPDIDTQPLGEVWTRVSIGGAMYTVKHMMMHAVDTTFSSQIAYGYESASFRMRVRWGGNWRSWDTFYSTGNTTKDVATGFLKASSPVLHVYNDKITKIHEAEQLDIKVVKKGVGHYEIHGTTGLRKNDGWFMSPPRDMHSNVLCMVDFEEKDGVIILKTYKKKFDFETVSIVHDYDNPMDIPEGSCVEFRFNDLPQEQLDEPIE